MLTDLFSDSCSDNLFNRPGQLPTDGSTHSWLGPSTLIVNQTNTPQACLQNILMEAIFSWGFLFLGVSSWQLKLYVTWNTHETTSDYSKVKNLGSMKTCITLLRRQQTSKHLHMWTLMGLIVWYVCLYMSVHVWVLCICVTIIIIEDIMNSRGTWGDMEWLGEGRGREKIM